MRKLLVNGARATAAAAVRYSKEDRTSRWLFALAHRRGANRAVVALANKTARSIWVVLMGQEYKQPEELLLAA